uniref:Protein quaking n=1 Tax=Meloidogyne incognita TaxID=6306 RepID=A0A914KMI1_MELIC
MSRHLCKGIFRQLLRQLCEVPLADVWGPLAIVRSSVCFRACFWLLCKGMSRHLCRGIFRQLLRQLCEVPLADVWGPLAICHSLQQCQPPPTCPATKKQEQLIKNKSSYGSNRITFWVVDSQLSFAKQLEHETGCKIMVRGRGSLRDTKKEEANRGKPNWEHLEDNLHILIQCEDTEKRARSKLEKAVGRVKKLLVPTNNGIDELKRKQLMELSIINGTYRSAIGPKNPPSLFSSHFPFIIVLD